MNEILLILHLFGFGAGVASSVGNIAIMRMSRAAPADGMVLAKLSPVLGRVGQVGLGVLWITGIILVWSKWGGPQYVPPAFWAKFVCVVLITGVSVMLGITAKQIQAGNRALIARMPILGAASGVLLILIVIFAVYAFD
ncbi:MAG: hypothetical protein WDM94_12175 [Bauldia sp.]